MAHVELDIIDPDGDVFKASIIEHHLTFTIIQRVGPGGGNPLVRFSGNREDLVAWITRYYAYDEQDAEDYSSYIEDQ